MSQGGSGTKAGQSFLIPAQGNPGREKAHLRPSQASLSKGVFCIASWAEGGMWEFGVCQTSTNVKEASSATPGISALHN